MQYFFDFQLVSIHINQLEITVLNDTKIII